MTCGGSGLLYRFAPKRSRRRKDGLHRVQNREKTRGRKHWCRRGGGGKGEGEGTNGKEKLDSILLIGSSEPVSFNQWMEHREAEEVFGGKRGKRDFN